MDKKNRDVRFRIGSVLLKSGVLISPADIYNNYYSHCCHISNLIIVATVDMMANI